MALPGGRWQSGDPNLEATVQREVLEEIGVELVHYAERLGELPSVMARARGRNLGLLVVPFVFHLTSEPRVILNEEVDEVIWTGLAPMLHPHGENALIDVTIAGEVRSSPAWMVGGHPVWGLTYTILQSFFQAILSSGRVR